MRHGVTNSLIYQFQHLIWQHLHQTKKRKYLDKFPSRGIATLHTHTRLYKAVYYRKKSILTIEYLHYKSFSNLYGVADWLIISGLNAILPCASSFIKYNIYMYDMWFCG